MILLTITTQTSFSLLVTSIVRGTGSQRTTAVRRRTKSESHFARIWITYAVYSYIPSLIFFVFIKIIFTKDMKTDN